MRWRVLVAAGIAAIATIAVVRWRCGGEATRARASVAATIQRMTRAAGAKPSLSGRVTRRSDGDPIAGAMVSIARPWGGVTEVPASLVTTDRDGRWEVQDLAPGVYTVAATARGFVPATRDRVEIAPGQSEELDLALDAGGTPLGGVVTDVNGGPIARARIIVHPVSTDEVPRVRLVAVTAADGRYQIDLADGSYQLEATHDDYMPAWENVEVAGAKTVDFRLLPGAGVRGRVIAGDTGETVPDATVLAVGPGSYDVTRSDDDGRFALHHLGGGAIWVRASTRSILCTSPTSTSSRRSDS